AEALGEFSLDDAAKLRVAERLADGRDFPPAPNVVVRLSGEIGSLFEQQPAIADKQNGRACFTDLSKIDDELVELGDRLVLAVALDEDVVQIPVDRPVMHDPVHRVELRLRHLLEFDVKTTLE